MADNTVLNPGTGGDTIATDDIAGVKHQMVKVEFGGNNTATPVSATDPLPVVQTGTPDLPTGAATAANQQTDALTDTELRATPVDVDTGLTQPTTPSDTQPVSAESLPLPTGAATSANQTTVIGHLDGVETTLTAMDSKLNTLDNAIAGTEMQVDVVGALPAGNNNIGDVDVASLPVAFNTGTRSATTQRVTIATDDSVPVTNAGLTALNGAIAGSEVQVDIVSAPTLTINSHAVTNAGTFAVQSTNQTGDNTIGRVKITDGTDVADILDLTNSNPIATAIVDGNGTQITSFGGGTQYTEGDTDSSVTGTALMFKTNDTSNEIDVVGPNSPLPVKLSDGTHTVDITSSGHVIADMNDGFGNALTVGGGAEGDALLVTLANNSTGVVSVDDNGGSLTVDGTVTANLAAGTNNIGDVDVLTLPALPAGNNNIGDVDVATLPVAFNSGATSATTQRVILATDTTVPNVTGNVAHDGIDSGNPIKVGGKAASTAPAAVADGDRVDAAYDIFGDAKTVTFSPELNTSNALTSLRDLMVAQRYTVWADSLADGLNSQWTASTANGGTATSTGGEGVLDTSASATGSAQLVGRTISYYPGQSAWFNSAARFNDTGSAGNIRRLGVFTVSGTTPQEGFYFELNGTTLNAVVVKGGSATATASTSWSRVVPAPFTLDTSYHSFEIRYTANRVEFNVDNVIRHTVVGTTSAITTTLNFPITLQSINTSGASSRTLNMRNCGIGRFGTPGTDAEGRAMVAQKAATAAVTSVAGSASSVQLLAANTDRIGATITNASSAVIYIKLGTTATTSSGGYTVSLAGSASAPFSYFEVPAGYTGRIDAIWASAAGAASITEIT